MKTLVQHTGRVAVLDRLNVDTDQIIPKQFLKRVERTGYGKFLFYNWRYRADGSENADFELNDPRMRNASILVAGDNFGCGSSREHAPWALLDYGFRAIVAPSLADIFYNNCLQNGILPIVLPEPIVDELMARAADGGYELTVDLEQCRLLDVNGWSVNFEIDPFRRQCLLHGLDDIDFTLKKYADEIAAHEVARPAWRARQNANLGA